MFLARAGFRVVWAFLRVYLGPPPLKACLGLRVFRAVGLWVLGMFRLKIWGSLGHEVVDVSFLGYVYGTAL